MKNIKPQNKGAKETPNMINTKKTPKKSKQKTLKCNILEKLKPTD